MCMKNKEELRREFLRRRGEMKKEQVEAGSFCIEQRVLAMEEIRRAEDIFCYISFGKEAMTKGLLEKLHEGGKRVYVPSVSGREMRAVFWHPGMAMKRGAFGIWEPVAAEQAAEKIDVALVPGAVFDRQGRRIGYGGGYYDRWLAEHPCFSVALAYDFQVLEEIPAEPHDRRMDAIACPGKQWNIHT